MQTRPHAWQLSLICFQKRGGTRVESCCNCCASFSKPELVHALRSSSCNHVSCLSRMIDDAPNLGLLCFTSAPSYILPLRALNESKPLFVPMPKACKQRVFPISALQVLKCGRRCINPFPHMHDISYAFIQYKRGCAILGSCCSCCVL